MQNKHKSHPPEAQPDPPGLREKLLDWLRSWLITRLSLRQVFTLRCVATTLAGSERLIYLEVFDTVEACKLEVAAMMQKHVDNPHSVIRWRHLEDFSRQFRSHWVCTIATPHGAYPSYTWEIVPKTVGGRLADRHAP